MFALTVKQRRHLWIAGVLAMLAVGLDRGTKYVAVEYLPDEGFSFLSDFFGLQRHLNEGLVFHISVSEIAIFATVNLILLAVLYTLLQSVRSGRLDRAAALLVIFIGGASNLFDRVVYGAVIDFLVVGYFPVFNLADVFIVTGFAMLAFGIRREQRGKSSAKSS